MTKKNGTDSGRIGITLPLVAVFALTAFIVFMMMDSKASSEAATHLDKAIHMPKDANVKAAQLAYEKVILKTPSLREKKNELDGLGMGQENKIDYEKAKELVILAEKNENVKKREIAKMAVDELRNPEHKQKLNQRLVKVAQGIDKKIVLAARVSVELVERTGKNIDYSIAQERVGMLDGGERKDELLARLEAVKASG